MPEAPAAGKVLRFGDYEADLPAGQLRKRGLRIPLRQKPFQVLALLLENRGEVVTREQLQRRLWPDDVFVDFENNLNTAVTRLRQALNDSADQPHFIETLPKRGYRFIASVYEVPHVPEPQMPPRARLVVLPFVNSSGDPAQEYFSDAMTDEIITELAALAPERLAVIARTTAMHYKGCRKDVAQVRSELGVDYVVEGGVRRTNDHVGINVQLIRAADQAHIWAQRFEADLADVLRLQNSVARTIAVQVGLTPRATHIRAEEALGERVKRKSMKDVVAYNLFLQGRQHLYKWVPGNAAKAKEYLEAAIVRDPDFALAYDSLGELYWSLGFYGYIPPKEACSIGLCYALRALEIDNDLAETHALLGRFRKQVDFDWAEAEREMRRALELNPTSLVVVYRYATSYLMPRGRMTEAITELERVLEFDPLDLNVRSWLAALHWISGGYDQAEEQLRLVFEVDPQYPLAHLVLGQTRCMEHKFEEAIADLRTAVELHGGSTWVKSWLGLALAQGGHTSEARAQLESMHNAAVQAYVPPAAFAWIHLGLGEFDEAFVWLDRAVEARDHHITPIKSYPFLDPIRGDPRFTALLRKMKLEP